VTSFVRKRQQYWTYPTLLSMLVSYRKNSQVTRLILLRLRRYINHVLTYLLTETLMRGKLSRPTLTKVLHQTQLYEEQSDVANVGGMYSKPYKQH